MKPPSACSSEAKAKFLELVSSGGEVALQGLAQRIERAKALAFAYEGKEVVAVAALKMPAPNYHEKCFRKAKSTEDSSQFPNEIGWVFVQCEHRGQHIPSALVLELLSINEASVFATSHRDTMIKTLERLGFRQTGEPYLAAESEGEFIKLFVLARPKTSPSLPLHCDPEP